MNAVAETNRDVVVLLHGLGRTRFSMTPVQRQLERAGWRVVNLGYPGLRVALPELATNQLPRALARHPEVAAASRVHFVTHSMGGVLLRQFVATQGLTNLGRVVMLAPPNHGCEVADWLRRWPTWWFLAGPNRRLLGTRPDDLPARLGPATFDTGVIAGARRWAFPFGCWLPRPNDGLVTVARTRLDGQRDFTVVPSGHTFIMYRRDTLRQIVAFLRRGAFDRNNPVAAARERAD